MSSNSELKSVDILDLIGDDEVLPVDGITRYGKLGLLLSCESLPEPDLYDISGFGTCKKFRCCTAS